MHKQRPNVNLEFNYNFGLLLKTYKADFKEASRLIKSFLHFNSSKLKLVIVAPKKDIKYFESFISEFIILMDEESILEEDKFHDGLHGMSPGYLNQQIVKLKFWKTGIFKNYFCIDSDAYFIGEISENLFFLNNNSDVYLHANEDKDLLTDPHYYLKYGRHRDNYIKVIKKVFELQTETPLTVHGMITLQSNTLADLEYNFLTPKNKSYKDIISMAPLEFSWYLYWTLKSNKVIHRRDPILKTIHTRRMHIIMKLQRITTSDLSRCYVGLVLNSNYAKFYNIDKYDTTFLSLLIPQLRQVLHYLKKQTKRALSRLKSLVTIN